MVALLLKARSPLNATDGAGYTALHHAVAEGHGDTAVALLRAGAEAGKKDNDGHLALELAPGSDVRLCLPGDGVGVANMAQVRKYIERECEREGIEL